MVPKAPPSPNNGPHTRDQFAGHGHHTLMGMLYTGHPWSTALTALHARHPAKILEKFGALLQASLAGRSPKRMSRARCQASRRSVLTHSSALLGIREGATIQQPWAGIVDTHAVCALGLEREDQFLAVHDRVRWRRGS